MPEKMSGEDKLISCMQHIDENFDMLCDVCKKDIPLSNYVKEKEIEATLADSSVIKIAGNMPVDTVLETTAIKKDEAVDLAQKYLPEIAFDDVLCAYDISMVSNAMEYEPEEYNQVVKVNISNMDLEIKDTVALLHIIDEEKYEIIPLSSISENEIEFKTARFSTYILIALETNDDIYDVINKDTIKPFLDNIIVTPSSGTIGPNTEVVVAFDIVDANYDSLNGSLLYPDEIEVLVDGLDATTAIKNLSKETIESGERFTLTINNIWGNGDLSIKIPAGAIKDLALNSNDEVIINTGLSVSRNLVSPVTNFSATNGDSADSITINWQDTENTKTVTYVLEVSNGDNNWIVINNAIAPYTHGSLTKNMSFEYRIKVVDSEGNESEYVYTTGRTEYDSNYADVMIDTVKPVISLTTKEPTVDYIGASQELIFTFDSFDENYNTDLTKLLDSSFIINVGDKTVSDVNRSLTKEVISNGERFKLTLSNITSSGKLTIGIPAGVIIDSALNSNDEIVFDTGITVMNGETITKDAPTLVPDVHSIVVSLNQVSTIPISSIIYEYRLSGDGDFIKWIETTDQTVTITGLYSDTDYEVRTTVIDVANNSVTSDSSFTTTKKIDGSKITIDHESKEWTNLIDPMPKVTATITWNDTAYSHEYSFDNINWNTAATDENQIEINENVTIYARYSDGVGHSDPVEYVIENIDKIKPKIENINIPEGIANTKEITVSEIKDEGGSGLKGYYINKEADLSNATWQTLSGDNFKFIADEETTYYVWVIDNAGNISEAGEAKVTDIAEKVSYVKLPSEITLQVYDKVTPELEYSGDPADITWEIDDESIATIDPDTGEITGLASGETTARVILTNYDGTTKEAETKVIVTAIVPTLEILGSGDVTFTYGDLAAEIEFVYSEGEEIEASSSNGDVATATISGSKVIITPGEVGTATITLTTPEMPGYVTVSKEIKVTVVKRMLVVTWSGDKFTYNGTEKQVQAIPENLVTGDIVHIQYSGEAYTDAGNYVATITGLSGADSANYTIDNMENISHNWIIEKAERNLNINPTSLAVSYFKPGIITFSYEGEDVDSLVELANGSIVSATLIDGANSGEVTVETIKDGEETISIIVPESNNYKEASGDVSVISSLTAIEIVAESEVTLTYGEPKEITYTYGGDGATSVSVPDSSIIEVEHDEATGTIRINPIKASDEEVIITIKAEATNYYEETEKEIRVKVNKRPLEVTWSGDSFVYDGNEKKVTAIPQNTLVGDIVIIEYSGEAYTDAGNYVATITGLSGADASNYTTQDIENVSHNWVINKANRDLDVQNGITLTYGNSGEVTFEYTGEDVLAEVTIANENVATITYEDFNCSGEIVVTPVASGETIISVIVPESKNYNEISGDISVKINLASPNLEVIDSALTFVYGDEPKETTFSTANNVSVKTESEDSTIATAIVDGNKIIVTPHNVGTTKINVSTVESGQYMKETKEITVTVTPLPVILDWGNTVMFYDSTPKSVTAEVTNALPGDNVTVTSYTGNTGTEVGTYKARATALSNNNYTLLNGTNIESDWQIVIIDSPGIIVRQGDVVIESENWASGDVTIEIKEVEITGVDLAYEYSYNGIDWFDYTGAFGYTTETTSQTIYARGYNKQNGIVSTQVIGHILKLDKTDPKIILDSVNATNSINGIINKNSEVTITLNIEELVSGINNGEFTIDDIKVIATYNGGETELLDITKILVEDIANANIENGTYKYTLTLKDIEANGRLSLRFNEKAVNDRATRYNTKLTLNLGLIADNKGPDIGMIKTSADEYGRVYGDTLDLEVTATDDSGIKDYEWQVSRDGINWETFITDETQAEISDVIYTALEDGVHHFRVIVTDIVGNSSVSEMVSINIDITMNRKPTTRFETEQLDATRVQITAIVKSTKSISLIKVNSTEIDSSSWNVTKTNNEITVQAEYIATANGTYVWTVTDEAQNVATESINITTIDDTAATIVYKTFDVTEYSPAKIEFTSDQYVRISKIIKNDGTTTNIVTGKEYTGMTFNTVDFSRKVNVTIENIDFEKGTTFVFENKSFVETYVKIEKEIKTKVMYVRVVSGGTKLFNTLFTDEFTLENAEMLVNQMIAKTKLIEGKVASYYGMSSSTVEIKVSKENELKAAGYLAIATLNGETLKLNEYGDPEKLEATISNKAESNGNYTNGNISGINVFGNILNWTGDADKNTFRITIRAK